MSAARLVAPMLRVGLTGGIACGKSHVLARLKARGFHTVDLDRVAHEAMAKDGAAYEAVVAAFGPGVLSADGSVDRKALGSRVFADSVARERLNAIVHPRVRAEEARRASAWREDPSAVVVTDAALLVEAGVHLRFERLVVVHCRPEQQLRRLMARDGIDAAAAQARIDAQMPLAEKLRFAHFAIDSSGSLDDTARATDQLAEQLASVATARGARLSLPLERALGALVHGPALGPRGLTPVVVLEEIATAAGLEMATLAQKLAPPAEGVWYRAARAREAGPGAETLAAPVVLWSLYRAAPDPAVAFAAAASLARLTHRDGSAAATACLMARALLQVAVEGRVPPDLPTRAAGWAAEAERWGGAPVAATLSAAFRTAARHAGDVVRAREECEGGGADLAGALVGLAVGASVEGAPARVVDALRLLAGAGDSA